jgi:Mg-chelatase subunit ChlD
VGVHGKVKQTAHKEMTMLKHVSRWLTLGMAVMVVGMAAALGPTRALAGEDSESMVRPRVQVVFVLDTTGSMGGLIEGAKQKIWAITNQFIKPAAEGEPRPLVKLGLIGYRDRGDAYVTRVHDLTDDIDAIYGQLMGFAAEGGGDGPESVNQALHEAVENMSWSKSDDVLKIVFLVGDAPPHLDYEQDVKYLDTCKAAVAKGLVINTVQCGSDGSATAIWQEIARSAEGQYVQIGQTGDMVALATPVDEELAKLNTALGATVVPYGVAAQQREVASKVAAAPASSSEAAADRLLYLSKAERGKAVSGRGDLVADTAAGAVQLGEVKDADLPPELQGKSPVEREAYVKEQQAKRAALQVQIDGLLVQRQAFLDAQRAKLAAQGQGDAFDEQIARMVREQRDRHAGK